MLVSFNLAPNDSKQNNLLMTKVFTTRHLGLNGAKLDESEITIMNVQGRHPIQSYESTPEK